MAAVLEADAEDDGVPTELVVANVWEATWVIVVAAVLVTVLSSAECVS